MTEADLAAVAARAGFSFAVPQRSGIDTSAEDDSDSGSDIEDLDAMLAAEEAAAIDGHAGVGA